MTTELAYAYRYEYNVNSNSLAIRLDTYVILSETKCGIWIKHYNKKGKKFINLKYKKKYAHLTKEEALEAFGYRKRKELSIIKDRVSQLEYVLHLLKNNQTAGEYKIMSGEEIWF